MTGVTKVPSDMKDTTWYSKIGAAVKERLGSYDEGELEDMIQGRGFDLAEALEQGLSPGLSFSHSEAAAEANAEDQRLVVERSTTRTAFTLKDAKGKTLLHAKCSADGTRYDMYANGAADSGRPTFVMQSVGSQKDQWSLNATRCDRCEFRGKRQCGVRGLLRMCHYIEAVGDGQAFCCDVELPKKLQDGDRAVMCDSCGDKDSEWAMELTARRPRWNAKHKSLTLDFHGRCSMASAKNFQLEDADHPEQRHKFLYGKVEENRFVLDHRYPLGAVQAFAIALSASHWQ